MKKIAWLILVAVFGTAGWFAWALLTPIEISGQIFVMLRPGFSTRRIAAELKGADLQEWKQACEDRMKETAPA